MQKPSTPTTKVNVGANGAVTATQTSSKINAGNYGTAKAFLNITAVSGTSPTLVVKFQDSPTGAAGSWTDVASGAFSSQNATGLSSLVLTNVGPYLQAVQTVGGTTPSFTYDLSISGIN
jgi:hypothetical protein